MCTYYAITVFVYLCTSDFDFGTLLDSEPTLFSDATSLSKTLTTLQLVSAEMDSFCLPAISSLTSLHTLYLDNNEIDSIPSMLFSQLSRLSTLSMSGNSELTTISDIDVYGLRSLRTLDLSKTQIETISACAIWWLPSLQDLLLSGNPLVCDCNLQWLKSWALSLPASTRPAASDYICETPSSVANQSILNLTATQLVCSANHTIQNESTAVGEQPVLAHLCGERVGTYVAVSRNIVTSALSNQIFL
jgi:hypothetical protein